MTGLFRSEVVEARRGSRLGSISLVQPVSHWVLAVLAMICAAFVIGFFCSGEYTRRYRVVGELVPDLGLSTVVAPTAGVVAVLHADEGDHVSKRAAVVQIDVPRMTANGKDRLIALRSDQQVRRESLAAIQVSDEQKSQIQQRGMQLQRESIRQELSQIDKEVQTRAEQIRIGRETVGRYRQVADRRYVSLVQLNQQEQAVLDLVGSRQALERQASGLRRRLSEVEQALGELTEQRRVTRAASSRDLALLDQESVRIESDGGLLLSAPVSGLVANRFVEAGQAVATGQPIVSLLPQGSKLRAQLSVPSKSIGFVKPGDEVLLRYQAYPYQKFGSHRGTVIRVSRSAAATQLGRPDSAEPMYRVLVALDRQTVMAYGRPESLRPGLLLEADILGERRKLYEWVLDPLYSVTGRATGGAGPSASSQ